MKLILPLTVPVSSKKNFILNLNNYRNAHFLVLSKAKSNYSEIVAGMLPEWNRAQYEISCLKSDFEAKLKRIRKKDGVAVATAYEKDQWPVIKQKMAFLEAKHRNGEQIKFSEPVQLQYLYYHGNKRGVDVSNPCSIIDKFTCDALTAAKVWSDDNSGVVVSSEYRFAGVCKHRPRCELTISLIKQQFSLSS
jgi:Holliday junction resolvase RusA-like endonuclease